ncbi:phosphodiesterase [Sphingomonas sp. GlSt437]|uniref:phosphodiesterase n=1 Tax=Sphingomonas sp. GlSt437 TaxID=3389970 RepID=UPI003A85FFDA
MLIAQITDVHLGFEPDDPAEFNAKRLNRVLRLLREGPNRPDLLLVTGDLTDKGDAESYRRIANALSECPFPVYAIVGNHDDRDNFALYFPDTPRVDGFIHYALRTQGPRLIMLDTLEPGRHGGAFCEKRAAWLKARLAEDKKTPTIIVMHHPPVEVGIDWMNTHPAEPWVARFAAAIEGHSQVVAILCGHVHRPIVAPWRGTTIAVCPATAPQLALDLRAMDPDVLDKRAMVIADAPGYALHRWTEHGLVTHFDTAAEHVMLAKFDHKMQGLVRHLMEERPR